MADAPFPSWDLDRIELDENSPRVYTARLPEMVSGRTRRHFRHAVVRALGAGLDLECAARLLPARERDLRQHRGAPEWTAYRG